MSFFFLDRKCAPGKAHYPRYCPFLEASILQVLFWLLLRYRIEYRSVYLHAKCLFHSERLHFLFKVSAQSARRCAPTRKF